MDNTENKESATTFEAKVHEDLFRYLQGIGAVDAMLPECPDLEERWPEIAQDYLPDGVREFQGYPIVSLGWMMFVGLAMASYWDSDWDSCAGNKHLYHGMRDMRGYDNMDEAILEGILGCYGEEGEKLSATVAECASRVFSMLAREHIEPGTQVAMECYLAALHQLYLAGIAVELKALGYHMTKVS